MLKISLFELLIRGIAEGFIFVLANYAFARKKIVPIPYLLSSIILILFTYGVRLLDINFGVHTILILICAVLVCFYINKIDLFTAVKGTMLAMIVMVIVEAINVGILQLVFKDDLKKIIEDPFQKALAGIPGIILYGAIILTAYSLLIRKVKNRGENGTISK